MHQIAGLLIVVILIFLGIFQGLLIAGHPLGHYAWGGKHRVLPTKLRIASVSSIFIYLGMISIVLDRIGLLHWYADNVSDTGMWLLVGYFAFGIFLNGISRSKPERNTM